MRVDVTLFQKWNVSESFKIFFSRASCSAFSIVVAGAAKYLFAGELIAHKGKEKLII